MYMLTCIYNVTCVIISPGVSTKDDVMKIHKGHCDSQLSLLLLGTQHLNDISMLQFSEPASVSISQTSF